MKIAFVAIVIIALALAIGFFLKASSAKARCSEVLKVLGYTIRLYQDEHQGQLPRSLAALSNELGSPRFLICPGSGHTAGDFTNGDLWADFTLIDWPKFFGTNGEPTNYPMVYDRSLENHQGKGINVLSVDGHVEWDSGAEGLKKFAREHSNFDLLIPE